MTVLTKNEPRDYVVGTTSPPTDIPMIPAEIIYEGAAVGENSSSGNAKAFADGDTFLGFSILKADNSASGAAIGDVNARVIERGKIILAMGAAITDDDLNAAIYATDDNTFSKTDSGSDTQIGKLTRFISTTKGEVYFEATSLRSI